MLGAYVVPVNQPVVGCVTQPYGTGTFSGWRQQRSVLSYAAMHTWDQLVSRTGVSARTGVECPGIGSRTTSAGGDASVASSADHLRC